MRPRTIDAYMDEPTTRREFRASLGSRSMRKSDTKVKRASSGKMTKPTKKRYAQLVKLWLQEAA